MNKLMLIAAIAALFLAGCKKEETADAGGSTTTTTGSSTEKSDTGATTTGSETKTDTTSIDGAAVTKDQMVGAWTSDINEDKDGMKMTATADMDLKDDDTYSIKMTGNFDGENQGIKMSGNITAEQTGKWKVEGGEFVTTPDAGSTKGGVSDFKVEATDPKMAEAIKGKDAEMKKGFDDNFLKSLDKETKSKIKSLKGGNELTTENEGKEHTWKKS